MREATHFRVFMDSEVGIPGGPYMDDKLIESVADEDIETDEEILYAGKRTCH